MSGEQPSPLGDSDYREIAQEIAEEMKELDERLLSSEQPSPLGDSDYREIAEEIAGEVKEAEEGLVSGEQPSPPDDSDYREIAQEIAEEREKEVEAGQEYTAVVTKEPENMGNSDYGETAEEITEEMKAERGAEAIPEERKDEGKRSAILKRVYSLLSRYIIAIMSVVVVLIITFLFFEPLRCVIEHRFTEPIVTLIAVLAAGVAGITLRIAPPQIDKVLYNLYGGVAVTFIIVIIAMQFLTPPSKEDCGFATRVPNLTVAPTLTYTMTPTSTETPTNTPLPTPTPTLAARATRVWESVAILSPSEGEQVSILSLGQSRLMQEGLGKRVARVGTSSERGCSVLGCPRPGAKTSS